MIRGPSGSGVAGIRTLGFTTVEPRGNSIPFRDVAEKVPLSGAEGAEGREEKIRTFIRSRVQALSRIRTTPAIYYRVTRELCGGRAVPRVLFRSVPDRVHIYTTWRSAARRRRRWRRWRLLQEFPVDRYLREGIAAVW